MGQRLLRLSDVALVGWLAVVGGVGELRGQEAAQGEKRLAGVVEVVDEAGGVIVGAVVEEWRFVSGGKLERVRLEEVGGAGSGRFGVPMLGAKRKGVLTVASAPGRAAVGVSWGFDGVEGRVIKPGRTRLVLEKGVEGGGRIVNGKGDGVAGVRVMVRPVMEENSKGIPAAGLNWREPTFAGVEVVTDGEGRWRTDTLPKGMKRVHLSAVGGGAMVGGGATVEEVLAGTAEMRVLEPRGLKVRVVDAGGKAVVGAKVIMGGEVKGETDGEGLFAMDYAPFPPTVRVEAEGFVRMAGAVMVVGKEAVEVKLEEGRKVRGRLVGEDGKGLAGVSVRGSPQMGPARGRLGFRPEVVGVTDGEGRFELVTPVGFEVLLTTVESPGWAVVDERMYPRVSEEGTDFGEVKMVRVPRVRGRVVDAVTGEAVERFEVRRLMVTGGSEQASAGVVLPGEERGTFVAEVGVWPGGEKTRFVVSAEGYGDVGVGPWDWRSPPGGEVRVEMKREGMWEVRVVDAEGKAVVGARVHLRAENAGPLWVNDWPISGDMGERVEVTDGEGRVRLPAPAGKARAVALAEGGYGMSEVMSAAPGGDGVRVVIRRYGEVTVKLGEGMRAAGASAYYRGDMRGEIALSGSTRSKDGVSVSKAMAGEGEAMVLREAKVGNVVGNEVVASRWVTVKEGEKVEVSFDGVAVGGRVDLGTVPAGATSERVEIWRVTEKVAGEGEDAWTRSGVDAERPLMYVAKVDGEGRWEFPAVEAGEYDVVALARLPQRAGTCGAGEVRAGAKTRVRVGWVRADVGEMKLVAMGGVEEGEAAPAVGFERRDGTQGKLSDYRGKVVVVTFWATWCGPCRAELPEIKKLVAEHPGVVFLSVSLDERAETVWGVVEKEGLGKVEGWEQGWGGDMRGSRLLVDWGFRGIPAMFVVDEEGKVVRRLVGVGDVGRELKGKGK